MKPLILICSCLIFAAGISQNRKPKMQANLLPPVAKKKPHTIEKHGNVRTDDYYWLNERENPEVIDYLNQENDYYQKATAHTKEFQNQLFEEMKKSPNLQPDEVTYNTGGRWGQWSDQQ